MSIPLSSNFELSAQLPLDSRTIVADVTARNALATVQRYFGMVVILQSTGGSWMLANAAMGGTNSTLSDNANWIAYASGSSSSSPITIVNSTNLFSTGLTGTGHSVTASSYSNFFGADAGYDATAASNSNFLGQGAGAYATSANNSNFFGKNAGGSAASATNSNFFGQFAGYLATGATGSNFFGSYAGYAATNAIGSHFFGNGAGNGATNAGNSAFFGYNAGQGATGASSSFFVGYEAGNGATNANKSTLIGYRAGKTFSGNNIGANNIILGTNVSLPDATANGLNIGGIIFATGLYATTTGNSLINPSYGKVGINVVTPTAGLHLTGISNSAGGAPLKFSASALLSTTEIGALEYNGTKLYFTPTGTTRQTIAYLSDIPSVPSIAGLVPYIDATQDVDIGVYSFFASGLNAEIINISSTTLDSNINCNNLTLGASSDSFINIYKADRNQWHAHPNDLDLDTMGKARFGDGFGFGTGERLEVHGAENRVVLHNHAGLISIGDYDNNGNGTIFVTDATNQYFFFRKGLVYIGDDDRDVPLAKLHIQPGTDSVAPFMLSAGDILASPLNGAMEYDGTDLYFTPTGSTRETIAYISDLSSGYIPYTGGTTNVNLGAHNLTIDTNTFFVDATNNYVGVGNATATSGVAFEVGSSSTGLNAKITSTIGSELSPALTTGNWTLGTGWQYLTTPNRLDKNADGTGTATPTATTTIVAGTTYRVTITVDSISGSTATVTLGGTYCTNLIAATTYTTDVTATTTGKLIITPVATGLRITISSVSIKALTTSTGTLKVDGVTTLNRAIIGRATGFGASNNSASPLTVQGNIDVGSAALNTSAGIRFWSLPYQGSSPDAHLTVSNYLLEFGNDIALGNSYTEKIRMAAGNFTHTTAQGTFFNVTGNVTDSGTAGYTGMKVNITENSTGSGANNLLDLQVGGVSKVKFSNTGTATFAGKLISGDVPVYANNAAAVAGGLAVGTFYRTNADPDPVCVVH